jgi:hypothetical protein
MISCTVKAAIKTSALLAFAAALLNECAYAQLELMCALTASCFSSATTASV